MKKSFFLSFSTRFWTLLTYDISKAYNLNLLKSHLHRNMRPTMDAPRATKSITMPKFCRMLSDSNPLFLKVSLVEPTVWFENLEMNP